jgi:trehalose transport system substrate-binding protein
MPTRHDAHDDPWHNLLGQAFDKLHDDVQAPPDFAAQVLAEAQVHPPRQHVSGFVRWMQRAAAVWRRPAVWCPALTVVLLIGFILIGKPAFHQALTRQTEPDRLAGKPTITVAMQLAAWERQSMQTHVLPLLESACRCRLRHLDIAPEELAPRLMAMQRAGNMEIDLFMQDNMRLQELVDAGLVSPLTPQEAQTAATIIPELTAEGALDGRQYFLPFRQNVQIVYYQAEKLARYQLRPPQTWPELLEVARVLYEQEGVGRVLFKGGGGAPTATQLYEWIVSAGGDPFDFTHPGTLATFDFLAALSPYLAPASHTAQWESTNEALAQQNVYLAQNWAFGSRYLQQTASTTAIRSYSGWSGPAREAHVIGGDFMGIPTGASHREQVLALIRHMQSREVQEILAKRLGWPSVRTDVDVPADAGLQPHDASVQEALRHGIFRKHIHLWTAYERLVSEAVNRILWHHEAPKDVLASLADDLANLLGQAGL